jgi:hypothetical protein
MTGSVSIWIESGFGALEYASSHALGLQKGAATPSKAARFGLLATLQSSMMNVAGHRIVSPLYPN